MGAVCGCPCCGDDAAAEFTALAELHKQNAVASGGEVQFEYDARTHRLVPIVHHDANNRSAAYRAARPPGAHSGGASGGSGSDRPHRADSQSLQSPHGDSLQDGSMVDCVSNHSFDYDLGESTAHLFMDNPGARPPTGAAHPPPRSKGSGHPQHRFDASGGISSIGDSSGSPCDGRDNSITFGGNESDAALLDGAQRATDSPSPTLPAPLTLQDVQEQEELSRSEIYAAFMVAMQMMRFAEKKIQPTMRVVRRKRTMTTNAKPSAAASAAADSGDQQNQGAEMSPSVASLEPGNQGGGAAAAAAAEGSGGHAKGKHRAGGHRRYISNAATSTVITFVDKNVQQHLESHQMKPLFSSSADMSQAAASSSSSSKAPSPDAVAAASAAARDGKEASAAFGDIAADTVLSPLEPPEGERPSPMTPREHAGTPAPAIEGAAAAAAAAAGIKQRVELLELDARGIPFDGSKVKTHVIGDWDFFRAAPQLTTKLLNNGDCLFGFKCFTGDAATEEDLRVTTPIINLSVFANEQRDNNVPVVDMHDAKEMKKYTVIVSKLLYMVPGLEARDVDAAVWSSRAYCQNCIAGNCTFEDTLPTDVNTFRMNKPLVRFVYSLLVQLRISDIASPEVLRQVGEIDGFMPARALLYERTKRDKTKTDATVKCKCVLTFVPVPGGMLVGTIVCVLTSAIPRFLTGFISNMGSTGAAESGENVQMSRKFIMNNIVQPRRDKEAAAAEAAKSG